MDHIHPFWMLLANEILEISSLTDEDFIRLVAHYNYLVLSDKKKVNPNLSSRGYSEAALVEMHRHRRAKFQSVESCGLRFTKPFDHLQFEPFSYVLTLFENYQRGCLPFPGSVTEQPAQIMEIFSVIDAIRREQEAKLSEKLSGRNKHQNRTRAGR